jgi:uncharacterized protein YbcI
MYSQSERDPVLAAISNEVGRIHGRCSGRVPESVRTVWNEEFVVCVLEGVLTEPERGLIREGRLDRVRGDRRALRAALEPPLRALIETITGRPVRAYLSEIDPEDIGFEAFMLGIDPVT